MTSMGRRKNWWWGSMAALVLGLAVLAISCSTVQRTALVPVQIPGATYVGNDQCFYCHTNYARSYQGSIHHQVHLSDISKPGGTSCETCHGPGSRHVEAPRERAQLILNPGKDPQACFQCHFDVHAQFRLTSRHPVIEGQMNCVQCHDPHAADIFKPTGGLLGMARLNEQCGSCHREQARTFVFEHEAMREGCASCHQPHGAVNRKLLGEPDANLCMKCHAQVAAGGGGIWIGKVDHRALLGQGSCWSAGCHTAVHGSNFHPKMLY